MRRAVLACVVALLAIGVRGDLLRLAAQDTAPVLVVETVRGDFAIELFPREAPLSVAHILALAKASFYDGQRVHRALAGFVIQFGDPQTRDMTKRDVWGRGDAASSGHPIGIAETSIRRRHRALAVGLSHMGEPARADSQLYITLADRADLDGQYVVIGQVIEGQDVPSQLQVGDEVRRVYLRE